jgi:hypothetical protein
VTYPGPGTYPDTTLFPETAAARFMQADVLDDARSGHLRRLPHGDHF